MRYIKAALGIAALLTVGAGTLTPARAHADASTDTSAFSFASFDADYYLTRDAQNHSHLKINETLVADFPDYDQNHGIERAIPEVYDGHNVRVAIEGVTDDTDRPLSYKTSESNDNMVLRIGDANSYVHGPQTYKIAYSLQDVTKSFSDHDELFWNTNGTQWQQSFASLTARLHMDAATAKAYNYNVRCVMGVQGAADPCTTASDQVNGGLTFTFTADRPLQAGENLSFVAGFEKGTFAAYQPTTWEKIFPKLVAIWLIFNGAALVVLLITALRVQRRYGRPPAGRGTIIPEYLPPKEMSVLVASSIIGKTALSPTAQIIDLAVRHYLKVYEIATKKMFGTQRSYELELVKDINGLRSEEHKLIRLLFGDEVTVGQRVNTKTLGTTLQKDIDTFLSAIDKQAIENGYFDGLKDTKKRLNRQGLVLWPLSILLVSPGLLIGKIILAVTISSIKPLTEEGVEQRDYLKGLQVYMKLAEAERMRVLQSPAGAEKLPVGTDPDDPKQLVKLYERLLPYAILYGIEKDWVKQFAPLYQQTPDWYVGNWSTFNAVVFASSFDNFSAASTTSFSPPSSSSSSGFSGGGFSGGGAGGGGGGGW